jgi:hypothetical protein
MLFAEPLKPGIITRRYNAVGARIVLRFSRTLAKEGEAMECESEILCPAMLTNWWRF